MNKQIERHDILVHVIERLTREFPALLSERRIFLKLLSFVNVLTGTMRGAIFKSLERYLQICPQVDLVEVSKSIQADYDDILADISDENQQNFILLVTSIVKLNKASGTELLTKVIPRLKPLFAGNKNDLSRALFYDLMVYIYDNFDHFKPIAKSSLIHGLSDPSKEIKEKLIQYWNSTARLSLDPFLRLEQLLSLLYDQDEESVWLNNAIFLLLQVSQTSADFTRKIFDEPLTNCRFDPLHIN